MSTTCTPRVGEPLVRSSYGPWLSPTPTKISRRARHHGKHLLRAPHGAPGRVHQTPCALGCAFERDVRVETRARGALAHLADFAWLWEGQSPQGRLRFLFFFSAQKK